MDGNATHFGIEYTAHVMIMPIFLTIGFVGQLLNLFTLSQPILKGVSYNYLKAIALADLLSILALVPFVLRHANLHLKESFWAMWYHAHLEVPLINAFLGASTLCIVALTVERFLSICYPVTAHRASVSNRRTLLIVGALYLLALTIFIPSVYQKDVSVVRENNVSMFVITRNLQMHGKTVFKVYLMLRELVVRICPIVILIVLNIGISVLFRRIARKHRRLKNMNYDRVQNGSSERQRDLYDEEKKIYILIVITVLTFIICTLPAAILSLLVGERRKNSYTFQVFRAGANLLEVTSYVANFYIYCLCSREYRTAFLMMWRGQRPRRPSEYPLLVTPSRRRSQTPTINNNHIITDTAI